MFRLACDDLDEAAWRRTRFGTTHHAVNRIRFGHGISDVAVIRLTQDTWSFSVG
ncbi:MAG: hypothetical protein P8R54_29575 [Myxococcota bacterium]|nr:hypothetical protein [Myxococcota bacterium]